MKGNQALDALATLCGASKESENARASVAGATQSEAAIPMASNAPPVAQPPSILPKTAQTQAIPQANGTQQPFQQAVAGGGVLNATQANTAAAAQMALLQAAALQGAIPPGTATDPASINAIQQLAYLQYMQVAQAAALQAQMTTAPSQSQTQQTQVALPFVGQPPQVPSQAATAATLPTPQPSLQVAKKEPEPEKNSMQPPPPPSQVAPSQTTSSIAIASPSLSTARTSKPKPQSMAPRTISESGVPAQSAASSEDKRSLKRAANRRSAQLSRKRKKQFIEELKEENDELRRKEQILKSIPDLIVVFDSSGKLWFVSHSVSRFLDFSPRELEKASFWDRLCDESVRLLKAAFMDALAARQSGMDTIPLGSGVWELRLVDKDGTYKVVTLNGVVHFTGESPECVCTIRPRDEEPANSQGAAAILPTHRNVSVSSGGSNDNSSSSSSSSLLRPRIMPHQSAISNAQLAPEVKSRRSTHQISDGDSGSCISESGSDE